MLLSRIVIRLKKYYRIFNDSMEVMTPEFRIKHMYIHLLILLCVLHRSIFSASFTLKDPSVAGVDIQSIK